jgi:hypothetical protein
MPKLASYDRAALLATLTAQDQVISRQQTLACGMTIGTLRYRVRLGGPWQIVLPGIYLAQTGPLQSAQRDIAAFLHAEPAVAITGVAAAARQGIPCKRTEFVDVLVPRGCRRGDAGFVRLHRTAITPKLFIDGVVRYALPARAVADAARQINDAAEVRALVAASVQRGKVAIWQLAAELQNGPKRGSARLREVLAEVADGVRSNAEGDLRALMKRAQLPAPLFNAKLYVGDEFLASPDAWWRELGVAAEVDSKEWHLSPEDWEQTLARHARMTAQGILVLHFPPSKIRKEGWLVIREIRSALNSARGPLPHIRTVAAGDR